MEKTAVVTGASYGIGAAISYKLTELGFKVYGIARTNPKIDTENFIWLKANLLDNSELNSLGDQIEEKHLDLLINNAGICFLKKTLNYTDDDFDKMFNLNFKVQIKITKLLFENLTGGLIMNISSLADRYPDPKWGLYGSSKTALNLFFETMAAEEKQVKIINLLPSYVDTPMQHQVHDGTDFDWSVCMKPENIADAVENILTHIDQIETGSRVVVEKNVEENEEYTPEKLWSYSVSKKGLHHLR